MIQVKRFEAAVIQYNVHIQRAIVMTHYQASM